MNVRVSAVIGTAVLVLLGTTASGEVAGRLVSYDKLLVDEIELAYDPASPLQSLTDSETRRVNEAVRDALRSAAAGQFEVVAAPGPGVLRVHATVANLDAAKKDKHFWRFTPVGLVKTRIDAASGSDFVLRGATVVIELLDAVSGEPLGAASAAARNGTDAAAVLTSLRELAAALEAEARHKFAELDAQR